MTGAITNWQTVSPIVSPVLATANGDARAVAPASGVDRLLLGFGYIGSPLFTTADFIDLNLGTFLGDLMMDWTMYVGSVAITNIIAEQYKTRKDFQERVWNVPVRVPKNSQIIWQATNLKASVNLKLSVVFRFGDN